MPLLNLDDARDVARFADFLEGNRHAAITQALAWRDVKSNWTPYYVYLEDADGEIEASMSILTIGTPTGKTFAYATRGPVCSVDDVEMVARLYDEAEKYVVDSNVFLLRTDPEVLYSQELAARYENAGFRLRNRGIDPHSTIQPRLNMRLELDGQTEESLMASFHSKTRYNIRLAGRKGVTVSYASTPDDVRDFFEVHKIMAERQGISHRDEAYFQRMAQAYGDDLRVYRAEFDGQLLAAAMCISYGHTTWYAYGGSSNEHRNLMPNYLMQWEMIRWALERGTTYYDFGGFFVADPEDGLFRFKSGFVGTDNISEYIGEIDRVYDDEAYEAFING